MSPFDRSFWIGLSSVAVISAGCLVASACVQNDQQGNNKMWAQENIDTAVPVCYNGSAYLAVVVNGGYAISPYIIDGHFVKCDSNKRVVAQHKDS